MKKPAIASETTAGLCSGLFFYPEQIRGGCENPHERTYNKEITHDYIIPQKKIKIKQIDHSKT